MYIKMDYEEILMNSDDLIYLSSNAFPERQ